MKTSITKVVPQFQPFDFTIRVESLHDQKKLAAVLRHSPVLAFLGLSVNSYYDVAGYPAASGSIATDDEYKQFKTVIQRV